MTRAEAEKLRIGSRVREFDGTIEEVVNIEGGIANLYELKYVGEDGTLSKGSDFKVPSHFEYDEIIKI
jgi:hypothetical protein